MNAHELLKLQHRAVEDNYALFKSAEGDQKEDIGNQILTDLMVHAAVEEELYYPELEKAGEKALADEFRAEHQSAKKLITKLSAMGADDEEYEPTMKALMESVIHHVGEEEKEGMPKVQAILGDAILNEVGLRMEARSKELHESTMKRLLAAVMH